MSPQIMESHGQTFFTNTVNNEGKKPALERTGSR